MTNSSPFPSLKPYVTSFCSNGEFSVKRCVCVCVLFKQGLKQTATNQTVASV